jgi:hypothetical protein
MPNSGHKKTLNSTHVELKEWSCGRVASKGGQSGFDEGEMGTIKDNEVVMKLKRASHTRASPEEARVLRSVDLG